MNTTVKFDDRPDLISTSRVQRNPWQDVTFLAVLIMQLCWMVPWYRVITMSPENINPFALDDYFLFAALLLIPYGTALILDRLKIERKLQKSILMGLLIVLLAVSLFSPVFIRERVNYIELYSQSPGDVGGYQNYLPNELIIFFVVFFLWRTGTNIVQHGLGTRGVIGNFILGLVLFTAYILLNMATESGLTSGVEVFIFLFFGLVGLATTRIAMLRRLVGGSASPFSLKWLFSIVGAVFLIFSTAFGGAWIVGGDFSRWIGSVILGAAMAVITFLVSPFFYVTQWIINTIAANVEYKDGGEVIAAEGVGGAPVGVPEGVELQPPGAAQILSFVYLIALLILFIFIIVYAIRLYKNKGKKVEGKWDSDVLYQQRGNFLDAVKSLFNNDLNIAERWQEFREKLADRIHASQRIRYIFACLLDMADEMEIPRPNSDTPLEFTHDLTMFVPEVQPELMLITKAYNRVRYGQVPETEAEVRQVEDAWLAVKERGAEFLEARKIKIKG